MPEGAVIGFSQDKSTDIRQLLSDLQNSVLTAVVLVFIVILFALSTRAAILIGLAIPVSFLIGILLLSLAGLTVNIVVLFSLILAVGMLVDDAIIVTEFAERRMAEGMAREPAFELAAKRMAGPVIAATLTRVAAFSPLLFWPGIVGEFMKYMPITLIATLSASMLYALVFTPTLGAHFAKPAPHHEARDGLYMRLVGRAVRHPALVLAAAIALLVAVPVAYGRYGSGVEFFPNVEPEYGLLYVHARGNLSIEEKDALVRQAEERILGWPSIKSVYTRVGSGAGQEGGDVAEDVVGVIQYEFVDWRERESADAILDELRSAMTGIPGADVEVSVPNAGPPTGKAIQVQLSAVDPAGLDEAARAVADMLRGTPDVIDVADGLPAPGVDWELEVDRARAAQYGVSTAAVGSRGAARHQRRQAHRLPPRGRRRRGRHPDTPAGGSPHLRHPRQPAHRDRRGLGADRQLRGAPSGADHRHPEAHRRPAHGDGGGGHPRRGPGRPGAPGGDGGGRRHGPATPRASAGSWRARTRSRRRPARSSATPSARRWR